MGCSCICAVVPRLSSHTNVGVEGGKNTTGNTTLPQGPRKHSHKQYDTCRPEKRGYSFPSSFETDVVFTSERLLFPFVGREQDPLCHCTWYHQRESLDPSAPQLLPQQDYFKAHSTPPCPGLPSKLSKRSSAKMLGAFLILVSVQE